MATAKRGPPLRSVRSSTRSCVDERDIFTSPRVVSKLAFQSLYLGGAVQFRRHQILESTVQLRIALGQNTFPVIFLIRTMSGFSIQPFVTASSRRERP